MRGQIRRRRSRDNARASTSRMLGCVRVSGPPARDSALGSARAPPHATDPPCASPPPAGTVVVGGVADDAVVGVVVAVGGGAVVGAGTGWLASARTSWSTSSCCSDVNSIGCFALWLVAENELGTALRTLTTYSTTYSEMARCDWPAMGEFFRGWWAIYSARGTAGASAHRGARC